jgi:hypothetical protein
MARRRGRQDHHGTGDRVRQLIGIKSPSGSAQSPNPVRLRPEVPYLTLAVLAGWNALLGPAALFALRRA